MVDYLDFSVEIAPKQGETYPVVVRSPAGEGRGYFQLPFSPEELGSILAGLGSSVRGTGETRHVALVNKSMGPEEVGEVLFNALFSGSVRSLLDRSLGMIHGQQQGLRIKLHIDPANPSLAPLAGLPWEFLYRRDTRDFINLSRFTPLVRYLDVQRPYVPLPLALPLRVLVVMSDPIGYPGLDLQRERALIEESWARQEVVQVDFVETATVLALQDALSSQPYHVLHYMGHGAFDERTGRGALLMEDSLGRGDLVDGARLGTLLGDVPTMRLVFLNACETARSTTKDGVDPFSGVAAAMVMAGIPAVVAMQFPITDMAAITFSQRFYTLVARGEPVDAAVAEGRRAIFLSAGDTMEWGTPVLFMRAPQGVLFQVDRARPAAAPPPEPRIEDEPQQGAEDRLAALYSCGLAAFRLGDWDSAAHCYGDIVQARPDYRDAAARLREAKRQQRLASLYASARQLSEGKQWRDVVAVFGEIQALEPGYADPDGLLAAAQAQVATLERREALDETYRRAVAALQAERWDEAKRLLLQVQSKEAGYRETAALLERVDAEITQQAERQRRAQADALYNEALALLQAGRSKDALSRWERVQRQFPGYLDVQGVQARAREGLAPKPRAEAPPKLEPAPAVQPRERPLPGPARARPRKTILVILGVVVGVPIITVVLWFAWLLAKPVPKGPPTMTLAAPTIAPLAAATVTLSPPTAAPTFTTAASATAPRPTDTQAPPTSAPAVAASPTQTAAYAVPTSAAPTDTATATAYAALPPTTTAQPAASATPPPTLGASRTPTATRPPATATPRVGGVVQITVQGMDAWGLDCSTLVFVAGDTVVARAPLTGTGGAIKVDVGPATWFRLEGSPDGKCPWGRWTALDHEPNRIEIRGTAVVLTYGAASQSGAQKWATTVWR